MCLNPLQTLRNYWAPPGLMRSSWFSIQGRAFARIPILSRLTACHFFQKGGNNTEENHGKYEFLMFQQYG